MAEQFVIQDEDRLGDDVVVLIPEPDRRPRFDRRAAVAGVYARRGERLKRRMLAFLVGNPSTTAEIAGHIHRSLSWTRSALLGMRVVEDPADTWTLADEYTP
jgi:hypothetical protein